MRPLVICVLYHFVGLAFQRAIELFYERGSDGLLLLLLRRVGRNADTWTRNLWGHFWHVGVTASDLCCLHGQAAKE